MCGLYDIICYCLLRDYESLIHISHWYSHTGWLGIKHQLSYLLIHSYTGTFHSFVCDTCVVPMLSFEWNKEVLTSLDKEVACNINLHWRQFALLSPVAGLCLAWKGSECTKVWVCRRWRGPHRPASIPPRPQGPGSSLLWTLSRSSTLDMKSRHQRYGTLTGRLFREKATFMIVNNIQYE